MRLIVQIPCSHSQASLGFTLARCASAGAAARAAHFEKGTAREERQETHRTGRRGHGPGGRCQRQFRLPGGYHRRWSVAVQPRDQHPGRRPLALLITTTVDSGNTPYSDGSPTNCRPAAEFQPRNLAAGAGLEPNTIARLTSQQVLHKTCRGLVGERK